ncbi:MAG: tetratricopeptide repeat protein [Alphaproteobacteria bacterium]|nr:tetratricopeptide repeat protein [Alphaproteobacteria bacterium]
MLRGIAVAAFALFLIAPAATDVLAAPGHSKSSTMIWMAPSSKVAQAAYMLNEGEVQEGMRLSWEAIRQDNLEFRDRAAAFNNLCIGSTMLRQYENAVTHCSTAHKLNAQMWQALNNRANAYFWLGRFDEAIQDYENAIRLRPNMDILRRNLDLVVRYKELDLAPPTRGYDS